MIQPWPAVTLVLLLPAVATIVYDRIFHKSSNALPASIQIRFELLRIVLYPVAHLGDVSRRRPYTCVASEQCIVVN